MSKEIWKAAAKDALDDASRRATNFSMFILRLVVTAIGIIVAAPFAFLASVLYSAEHTKWMKIISFAKTTLNDIGTESLSISALYSNFVLIYQYNTASVLAGFWFVFFIIVLLAIFSGIASVWNA